MAKKSNILLELWQWLDGRKQAIALFVIFATGGLSALQTHGVGDFQFWVDLLGAIGSGHKVVKGV